MHISEDPAQPKINKSLKKMLFFKKWCNPMGGGSLGLWQWLGGCLDEMWSWGIKAGLGWSPELLCQKREMANLRGRSSGQGGDSKSGPGECLSQVLSLGQGRCSDGTMVPCSWGPWKGSYRTHRAGWEQHALASKAGLSWRRLTTCCYSWIMLTTSQTT